MPVHTDDLNLITEVLRKTLTEILAGYGLAEVKRSVDSTHNDLAVRLEELHASVKNMRYGSEKGVNPFADSEESEEIMPLEVHRKKQSAECGHTRNRRVTAPTAHHLLDPRSQTKDEASSEKPSRSPSQRSNAPSLPRGLRVGDVLDMNRVLASTSKEKATSSASRRSSAPSRPNLTTFVHKVLHRQAKPRSRSLGLISEAPGSSSEDPDLSSEVPSRSGSQRPEAPSKSGSLRPGDQEPLPGQACVESTSTASASPATGTESTTIRRSSLQLPAAMPCGRMGSNNSNHSKNSKNSSNSGAPSQSASILPSLIPSQASSFVGHRSSRVFHAIQNSTSKLLPGMAASSESSRRQSMLSAGTSIIPLCSDGSFSSLSVRSLVQGLHGIAQDQPHRRLSSGRLELTRGAMDIYNLDALHTDMMMEFEHNSQPSTAQGIGSDAQSVMTSCPSASSQSGQPTRSGSDGIDSDGTFVIAETLNTAGPQALADSMCQVNSIDSGKDRISTVEKRGTMDALRARQECSLVQEVSRESHAADSADATSDVPLPRILRLPQVLFHICGIVPFSFDANSCLYGFDIASRFYSRFVLLILVFLLYPYINLMVAEESRFWYMNLSKLCSTLGCWVGLAVLHVTHVGVGRLVAPGANLEEYAARHGFLKAWYKCNVQDFILVLGFWLGTVGVWILLAAKLDEDCLAVIGSANSPASRYALIISPIFASGIFALLSYFQLHICRNLELMVDSFCWYFFQELDCLSAVNEWNKLQAILRRTANTIDSCFLATTTSVGAASLLFGAELWVGAGSEGRDEAECVAKWSSSALPYLSLALYGLFRAATVSEKCSRVPALVNSLRIDGNPMHSEQHYLVQYIEHSAAGFYIKGVRLTAFHALKATYITFVFCFMCLTRTESAR